VSRSKTKVLQKTRRSSYKSYFTIRAIEYWFQGPIPSKTGNNYILSIIDEFSRFPFAIPCRDLSSATVIKCLSYLFFIFGMPAYIHSDRGAAFLSQELTSFLCTRGIATSRTTPYNSARNGQVERYSEVIWKTVWLAIQTRGLKLEL